MNPPNLLLKYMLDPSKTEDLSLKDLKKQVKDFFKEKNQMKGNQVVVTEELSQDYDLYNDESSDYGEE